MNEIGFWNRVVKPALNVKAYDRVAWKVGTSTRAGLPDVAYRSGPVFAWIELKYLDNWPARDSTPLRLNLTAEQRAHLREWCFEGQGSGFVLLGVDSEILLLPWYTPDPIDRELLDDLVLGRIPKDEAQLNLGRLIDHHIFQREKARVKEAVWLTL